MHRQWFGNGSARAHQPELSNQVKSKKSKVKSNASAMVRQWFTNQVKSNASASAQQPSKK